MIRKFTSFTSLLFALALTVSVAQAQTGSGTTTDPNATTTTTDRQVVNDFDDDRGPDLGWLGLLGLAGLFGLKRRPVQRSREDEVRGGRAATI